MTSSAAARPTTPVLADLVPWVWVRDVALVGAFTVLIAVGAQLAVPVPGSPVPVTAQTFVVLLGAAALGPVRAGIGAGGFLVAGVLGVPWFAVTGGATLGYIAGFVVAGVLIGRLARGGWTRSYGHTAAAMVVGNLTIYVLGASVLAVVLGLGALEALTLGVVPYLVGDAIKIGAATALLPTVQRAVER